MNGAVTRVDTRRHVEGRVVEAFRVLPGRPCMTMGTRLVEGRAPPEACEAFGWVDRFVCDPKERKALLTWARCVATEESWQARCNALGWVKRSADRARGRAASRIVRALRSCSEPGMAA